MNIHKWSKCTKIHGQVLYISQTRQFNHDKMKGKSQKQKKPDKLTEDSHKR